MIVRLQRSHVIYTIQANRLHHMESTQWTSAKLVKGLRYDGRLKDLKQHTLESRVLERWETSRC